jgi:hypothetical protein
LIDDGISGFLANPGDSADYDYKFNGDFADAISGGNVVAVFAGHIHQDYGNINTLNVGQYNIPVFRSGSAECLKFLDRHIQ